MDDTAAQTVDGVNWLGLGGLALILCLFGLLFLWFAVLPARREARELADLVRRRDWDIERIGASGGRPTRITFKPRGSTDWRAEITRCQNGNVQIRGMTVHLPDLRIPDGLVVMGPAIGAGPAVATLAQLGGGIAGALLRGVDDPAVTQHLSRLRAVDGAGPPGMTALASDPAGAARIAALCTPDLTRWLDHHAAPVVIVTAEGSRLRWREHPTTALAEALIDLGQALTRRVTA